MGSNPVTEITFTHLIDKIVIIYLTIDWLMRTFLASL